MNIWSRLFVPASPLVVAEPKKSRDKKIIIGTRPPSACF